MLWSSEEFGFCEVADRFASGSSLMPQKKNPDAAELLRAKAPRVAGRPLTLHGVLHGLPLTYNKDLQEDKEQLFDAIDTVELCLEVATADARHHHVRPRAPGRRGLRRVPGGHGRRRPAGEAGRPVPDRRTGSSPGVVRAAVEKGKGLSELTTEELAELAPELDGEFYELLRDGAWLESKVSEGGTSLDRVRDQLGQARHILEETSPAGLTPEFYDRPVLEVARDLVGCAVRHGEHGRADSGDRGLPRVRARLPRVHRPDAEDEGAVRPAGSRLRLPLLRDPRPAERRDRARREWGRRC